MDVREVEAKFKNELVMADDILFNDRLHTFQYNGTIFYLDKVRVFRFDLLGTLFDRLIAFSIDFT